MADNGSAYHSNTPIPFAVLRQFAPAAGMSRTLQEGKANRKPGPRPETGEQFYRSTKHAPKRGWYNAGVSMERWQRGLARTRSATFGRIASLLGATEITPAFWHELEAGLIQADMGIETSQSLIASLQARAAGQGLRKSADVRRLLRQELIDRLPVGSVEEVAAERPYVILLVGVNGCGKTTTAARLAWRHQQAGRSVLLAAADTFRAAAAEQLSVWGERLKADVISAAQGSDPGSVVYRAIEIARSRKIDIVIADTSGRMHTSHNLMAELAKIKHAASKAMPGAPHQTLLVLDATTGQNSLAQAEQFKQAVGLDGIIMAKLDTSARGGMAVAVAERLGLPLRFVGLGEAISDLASFDPQAYVSGLLAESEAS
jgi:fused signal recognition particle receptor